MENTHIDFEDLDPSIVKLEEYEQRNVASVLRNLARQFPDQDLGHEIREIREDYFELYLAGFKGLDIRKIRRVVVLQRGTFRSYTILPDRANNTIGVLLSFYRGKSKGQKPLIHESKIQKIQFQDLEKSLKTSSLGETEKKIVIELAQQFCFVERYSSGDIMATFQDSEDHYELIFSNVREVFSGFIASYLSHFKKKNIEIYINSSPFEVCVRINRNLGEEQVGQASKKRNREDEEDTFPAKRKK